VLPVYCFGPTDDSRNIKQIKSVKMQSSQKLLQYTAAVTLTIQLCYSTYEDDNVLTQDKRIIKHERYFPK
jgi:tagatose-1,6-bisphosphate aldolase